MIKVGCHVSIAGSIDRSVERARERGCDTFQLFTRTPRGWKSRTLDTEEINRFKAGVKMEGLSPVFSHMPYLPNLASPRTEVYERSVTTLKSELERCLQLDIPYLITHLGSHLGEGSDQGISRLVAGVNTVLEDFTGTVTLLLENTAGTKNSLGGTFEDMQRIIGGIEDQERIGVCLDTCHAFSAGYDFSTPAGLESMIRQFDEWIGIDRLKVIHLNDSKGKCGSRLDRHEHLGLGQIGEAGLSRFLRYPSITGIPLICETPVDQRRDDRGNIEKAREMAGKIRNGSKA